MDRADEGGVGEFNRNRERRMRIFALQPDNDIKGIAQRKAYIESLLAALPEPDTAAGIKTYEANKGKAPGRVSGSFQTVDKPCFVKEPFCMGGV